MQNSINNQLLELYQNNWPRYLKGRELLTLKKEQGEKLDYTRPLLIKLKDDVSYEQADKKVMILGQETNGWAEGKEMTPENSMNKYVDFFNDGNVNYRGPFWNEAKRFIRILKNKFPNQKIAYTYNNVVKIGKSSGIGFPGNTVYDIELSHFNVMKKEIEILKPDLLLFFSGPHYDLRVQDKLGNCNKLKVKEYKENELCKLEFIDKLPISFRTYHPRAMYQQKVNRLEYFNSIIDATFDN